MSVYVVSKGHIDALVNAGRQLGLFGSDTVANEIGRALWEANAASVSHDWNEPVTVREYSAEFTDALFDPVAIAGLVDGYRYQACEFPEFAGSAAGAYCVRLKAAAVAAMPAELTGMLTDRRTGSESPRYTNLRACIGSVSDLALVPVLGDPINHMYRM
jgi:hypothetical protein